MEDRYLEVGRKCLDVKGKERKGKEIFKKRNNRNKQWEQNFCKWGGNAVSKLGRDIGRKELRYIV